MANHRWQPAIAGLILLIACSPEASPSPPTTTPEPTLSPPTSPSPDAEPTATPEPTPTPEPALGLSLPEGRDPRMVEHVVSVQVPPDGSGRIEVTVTSLADTRIEEIVVRWPTELSDHLVLAPLTESLRVPLLVPWTKWVEGPGEEGEPAGSTSIGWGPLDPGATVTIVMTATRSGEAPADLAFDLQVLAGEAILTAPGGEPAVSRVEVP